MVDKAILPVPKQHFEDQDGNPLAGGKVFIYEAGTTTKAESWTSADGLTSNTNPIILDARGECNIWVEPGIPDPVVPNPPGPPGPRGPQGIPGPPGATGNTAEFSTTVDILSQTIYTGFYGEYIELVPNPDANVLLVPVMIALSFSYATVAYVANSGNFVVLWGPPTIPVAVPNFTFSSALLEAVENTVLFLPDSAGLNAESVLLNEAVGKPLTLTIDTDVDGAPLISIDIDDGGSGYAVSDTGTIDDGTGGTYEVLAETAGVVTSISLTAGGNGYSSGSSVTTATGGGQPGSGSGLTLSTLSAETISGSLRVVTWYRRVVT